MKQITVILPCYNVENYIDRVMTSLEEQTIGIGSLEIICVDDCSTDSTPEKISRWEQKYPDDIIFVPLKENSRQGACRNIALGMASCEFVAFIDSDDWVERNYLERLLAIAEKNDLDVVQCGFIRDHSVSLFYKSVSENAPEIVTVSGVKERKALFHEKRVTNTPWAKLIRRELLTDNYISFSEGIFYEDSYWGVLLNMYLESVGFVSDRLYHYFVNENSTVLTRDTDYNIDLITNQIGIWNELKRRGFMEAYRDEIEMEHVYSCALIFWKMLALRYEVPPYSYYRLLCAVVSEHVPDIMDNPYVKAGELKELYMLLLESCLKPLSKSDFIEFAGKVRKIGL